MFKDVSATTLAATVIKALIERTGLDPERVDDVILGQCYPSGEAPAIGRVAALDAGLPVDVPGIQLDRRCGSGLQAIINATMQVQTGACDIVLAGGVESMSQVEFYSPTVRWGPGGEQIQFHDRLARARVTAGGENHPVPGGMLETAENLRREYSIPREEQDEFALRSHQRAVAAQQAGRFDDEIVPVDVVDRKGTVTTHHPRRAPARRHDRWNRSAGCVPCSAGPTARRRLPPATPAARTTALRSASSPPGPSPRNSASRPRSVSSAGASPACRRRPWASARFRLCERRSSAATSRSRTWTSSS